MDNLHAGLCDVGDGGGEDVVHASGVDIGHVLGHLKTRLGGQVQDQREQGVVEHGLPPEGDQGVKLAKPHSKGQLTKNTQSGQSYLASMRSISLSFSCLFCVFKTCRDVLVASANVSASP